MTQKVENKLFNSVKMERNQGSIKYFGTESEKYKEIRIKDFYKDAIILITGGTGFVGKALIEKLLRSCEGLKAIYVLVRSKRGLSGELRYNDLIQNKIFDRLRLERPFALRKLLFISGDILQPHLGLNERDLNMVIEKVNIVFHNAATVKFNEALKDAGDLNACGTQRLMELCSKFNKLRVVVHVSTAYCNPGRKYVGEKVYPPSPPLDGDSFMKCINILPDNILTSVSDLIQGSHPNTYTLTKSIAEQIVKEYSHKFPVLIIRPSIVTAAVKEPYPGWIDNIQGITGIMMEIGRGTISSILGDQELICDIIPVDVVVNTMICAAWSTSIHKYRKIQVFNCVSGQTRPILWQELGYLTEKWARINPSKYVVLYPNFSYRKNEFIHKIYETFLHFLPAYIFDIIIGIQGSKPKMMKLAKRLQNACKTGKFFALHEWIFEIRNQENLIHDINNAEDGNDFFCDIRNLNYDYYIRNYMLGIRKFILQDDEASIQKARIKLWRLFWCKTIFQILLICFSSYSIAKKIVF